MKKYVKEYRKNRKKYKCNYCPFTSDNEGELKRHEEYYHGCYRDINPRVPKVKNKYIGFKKPAKEDNVFFGRVKIKGKNRFIDIVYEWDSNQHKYRIFTDELKYGNHIEIIENINGDYEVKNLEKLRRDWNSKYNIKPSGDDVFEDMIESEVY